MGASKKRKWIATVEEPLPSAPDDLDSWRNHYRLQRHARSYREHRNHGKLLAKYATDAVALDRKLLLRCICHVGAWVAVLPLDDVLAVARERSPVLLLAQLLRMRGRGKLTPWLHGVLRLVATRLSEAQKIVLTGEASLQLQELQRAMPSKILSELNSHKHAESVKKSSSSTTEKRIRLFYNEMTLWKNCEMPQRCERVRRLEERVEELKRGMDIIKLRALLRQVVAALSPPRASALETSDVPLDAIAENRLKQSASLQKTIRSMLLWGLNIWRNVLNLEDEQIRPLLVHVRDVIAYFEKHHGDIQQTACARKQWGLLKSFVKALDLDGCEFHRKKNQTTYTPSSGAKLKEAALIAFQRLGNEATALELLEKIRSDSDIWAIIAGTANREPSKSSVRMKNRKLEAWEASVVNNFPQRCCVSTGLKKDGLTIWRLSPSIRTSN